MLVLLMFILLAVVATMFAMDNMQRVELSLISASGKVLYHNILKNVPAGATEEIEMKDAASGIYLLKVVCDGVSILRNVAIY